MPYYVDMALHIEFLDRFKTPLDFGYSEYILKKWKRCHASLHFLIRSSTSFGPFK